MRIGSEATAGKRRWDRLGLPGCGLLLVGSPADARNMLQAESAALAVHVQCPHCRGVCQVQAQQFGTTVKCGRCAQPFGVPVAVPVLGAAASAPAPTSAPPGSASPAPPPPQEEAAVSSGIWRGLKDLYRALKKPADTPPGAPPRPLSEDEIHLELDGPGAAALTSGGPPIPRQALPPGNCRLDIGSCTSAGLARERNEDSLLVLQLTTTNLDQRRDVALVVVADGMGGYDAGDQASGMATRTIGAALLAHLAPALAVHGQEAPPAGLADQITAAIRAANRAVQEKAQKDPTCKGMGATAAVLVVWEGQALLGHVGDCRVYHARQGSVTQVTKDQTLVARMVEMGKITPQEALTHPNRNEVLQAIGRHSEIHPSSQTLTVQRGDWLIVACDGLHAHVSEKMLADAVNESPASATALANQLVELANVGGGSDNCTVVAVRCY